MQKACCCDRLLARDVLSWSYLFSLGLTPFPSFCSFPFFIAPNLKMARYEMLAIMTPKLQKDVSSAVTEALLCSFWKWLWLLPRRQGTPELLFTPAAQSTIWMSEGFLCIFPPKASGEVRLQSVRWSAGTRHSRWTNTKKWASVSRSISPKGTFGHVFCQLRVVLKLQETCYRKLVLGIHHQMDASPCLL